MLKALAAVTAIVIGVWGAAPQAKADSLRCNSYGSSTSCYGSDGSSYRSNTYGGSTSFYGTDSYGNSYSGRCSSYGGSTSCYSY